MKFLETAYIHTQSRTSLMMRVSSKWEWMSASDLNWKLIVWEWDYMAWIESVAYVWATNMHIDKIILTIIFAFVHSCITTS